MMGTPLNSRMTRSMYATVKDRSAEVAKRRREAEIELRRKRAERIKELEEKATKAAERKRQSLVEKCNKGRDAERLKEITQRRSDREKEEIERRKSLLEKKSNQTSSALPPKIRSNVAFGSAVKQQRPSNLMTSSCHPALNSIPKPISRRPLYETPKRSVDTTARRVPTREQEKRPAKTISKPTENSPSKQIRTQINSPLSKVKNTIATQQNKQELDKSQTEDNSLADQVPLALVEPSLDAGNTSLFVIQSDQTHVDAIAPKMDDLPKISTESEANDIPPKLETNPTEALVVEQVTEICENYQSTDIMEQPTDDAMKSVPEEPISTEEVLPLRGTMGASIAEEPSHATECADEVPENESNTENESGFETSSEKMADNMEIQPAANQSLLHSPENADDMNGKNSANTTSSTPNSELNGLIGHTVKLQQERSNRRAMMNEILSKTRDNVSPVPIPTKTTASVENSELLKSILSRRHFNDHNDSLSSTKTDSLPLHSDVSPKPNEDAVRVIENEFYKLSVKSSASDKSFLLPGQLAETGGVSQ